MSQKIFRFSNGRFATFFLFFQARILFNDFEFFHFDFLPSPSKRDVVICAPLGAEYNFIIFHSSLHQFAINKEGFRFLKFVSDMTKFVLTCKGVESFLS